MLNIRRWLFNKFSLSCVTILILCLTTYNSIQACMLVFMAKNNGVLVGYNEMDKIYKQKYGLSRQQVKLMAGLFGDLTGLYLPAQLLNSNWNR